MTTDPSESTIRRMNQSVSDVQADRSEFAKIVDNFAAYWTPCVLLAAVGLALIAGGSTNNWHAWVCEAFVAPLVHLCLCDIIQIHRSLVVLVLACPCAIVMAAPIPSVCAIANAAKHGVLIKGITNVMNVTVAHLMCVL